MNINKLIKEKEKLLKEQNKIDSLVKEKSIIEEKYFFIVNKNKIQELVSKETNSNKQAIDFGISEVEKLIKCKFNPKEKESISKEIETNIDNKKLLYDNEVAKEIADTLDKIIIKQSKQREFEL